MASLPHWISTVQTHLASLLHSWPNVPTLFLGGLCGHCNWRSEFFASVEASVYMSLRAILVCEGVVKLQPWSVGLLTGLSLVSFFTGPLSVLMCPFQPHLKHLVFFCFQLEL